jgi:hypothetical protein
VIVVEDHIVGYTNDMVYLLSTLKGDVGVKAKRLWLLGFNYILKIVKDWNAVIVFLYANLDVLRKRWRKKGTAEELFECILVGRVASRVLYRGVVHELPIIFGNVLELPEEYYILHYSSWSKSKLVFYAYLESLEYYQHATRSKIRKALWKLTPLSAPMTVMYHIILNLMMKRNPHINLCTLIRTIDTYSSYEILGIH